MAVRAFALFLRPHPAAPSCQSTDAGQRGQGALPMAIIMLTALSLACLARP